MLVNVCMWCWGGGEGVHDKPLKGKSAVEALLSRLHVNVMQMKFIKTNTFGVSPPSFLANDKFIFLSLVL